MTGTKHTPTPWHTEAADSVVIIAAGAANEYRATIKQIARTVGAFHYQRFTDEDMANAAFIVRAANAHEALVAAATEAEEVLTTMVDDLDLADDDDACPGDGDLCGERSCDGYGCLVRKRDLARHALALARSGE